MKKIIWMSVALVVFGYIQAIAQNPVPDPDTIEIPVQEGDPAVRTLPPRLDYTEDRKRITPEEIPDIVKQTLESSAQYVNWQRATIYHDLNKDEYIVEFKEKGATTTYRFNKEGKPIIEKKE